MQNPLLASWMRLGGLKSVFKSALSSVEPNGCFDRLALGFLPWLLPSWLSSLRVR